ncbi:MAG: GMC family oxidoreductase N-terminal domain-containing protein, partial [Alphaproteobacteria bacterium]|nr:GMC family oxidoreductase N-terminal domain-containing protein [Alphaproteobacteria bacterium]
MDTFDYVIVGAGAAGCVLANRLSASGKHKVALLAAGGPDRHIWIKVPAGFNKTVYNPRLNWGYETAPGPYIDGRRIVFPRGKVLGGSGSINGHLYVRGQAADYDTWAQLGCRGWSWDDVLPFFKRSQNYVHGADDMHGSGGEWHVEEMRLSWEILDAFREAAAETGIPKTGDFNRGNNEGCGYFQVNQRRGRRLSTAVAFLRPAMERPNLRVLTHAQAKSLRFDGSRAAGIEFWQGERVCFARAGREVILAAGAIGSPHLLQVSGVGAPELLQRHGIAVSHALPGVGENL